MRQWLIRRRVTKAQRRLMAAQAVRTAQCRMVDAYRSLESSSIAAEKAAG